MRRKLILIVALLVAGSWAGVAAGNEESGDSSVVGKLSRRDGVFEITLVNPNADFSRYKRLFREDVVLKFRPGAGAEAQSATGTNLRERKTKRSSKAEEQAVLYQQAMAHALTQELANDGHFEVVDCKGPDTLVLRVALVDLVSKIRKTGRIPRNGKLLAEGTFVFELIDAQSGIIQARIGERREARASETRAESSELPPPWDQIQLWAQNAASDLLAELHQAVINKGTAIISASACSS